MSNTTPANVVLAEPGTRYHCLSIDRVGGTATVDEHKHTFGVGGMPTGVYFGLVEEIALPGLNFRQANQLLRAIDADLGRIGEGSEHRVNYETGNPYVTLDDDARAAHARIERLTRRLMNPEDEPGFTVDSWLDGTAYERAHATESRRIVAEIINDL